MSKFDCDKSFKRLYSFFKLDEKYFVSFEKEVIENSKSILSLLNIEPEIFPVSNGSVQFEWEIGKKYLELVISTKNVVLYSEGVFKDEYSESMILENNIDKIACETNNIINKIYK